MKRTLSPLKGLDKVKFGMTLREVQTITGIKDSTVTNKYLKEKTVADGGIKYVFIQNILGMIDLDYQEGIYLEDVDLFTAPDVDALLKGHESESRKDAIHVKKLGLVLFKFRLKDRKKRWAWCYGSNIKSDYEHVLDIV